MLLLRLALLGIVAIVSITATPKQDMDEMKMQEMYNCFFAILCKAREARAFRRIMLKADSELIKNGFRWLKEISDIDAEDTDDFWDSYPDYKCPLPEEVKHNYFVEWLKKLGEYWTDACANAESEACAKMAAAEHEYNVVTAEYTARGVCSAQATEMGEKKMKESKENMEKGMESGKNAMDSIGNKGGMWGK